VIPTSQEDKKQEKVRTQLNPKQARNVKIFCIIMIIANVLCAVLMIIFWTIPDYFIILGLGMLGSVPAFFANAGMTFAGTFHGPGRPIDGGRMLRDGKRVFGEGKTWKGLIGGIIIGSTLSFLMIFVNIALYQGVFGGSPHWSDLKLITPQEVLFFIQPSPLNFIMRTVLLSVGACFGDLIGSFFKRRTARERGTPFPLLDQLDFLLFAYLCAYAFFPLPWYYILVISLFTPLVAVLANIVAYYLGKKHVPW
jgi:CDP-2,3-bis-(O-geranylgeranyl)-sn-glycerol synthase